MNIDTLICAKWIIPVEPDGSVFENHAIAVNNEKIIDLLPINDAMARYAAVELHDLNTHALIPGLINSHTHSSMSLFRGLADDLPLMEWLNDHIWPAEQQWTSPQFVEDGSRLAIAEMIRSGTTCFSDMYFFPDCTAEVAIEVGIRAVIGLIMIDFPTPWAKDASEYLHKGKQVYDKFKHNPLIKTAFAPHSPYTVSDEPLQKIALLAEQLDIQIHMHVHETDVEIKQSIEQHGKRPLQRLLDLGLLSKRLIAVHMTQLLEEEIELLAKHGVNIIHCPESNLKLASGFCPVYELLNSAINVALGTDGAASNNDLDMLGEMRIAAILAKGVAHDSSAIPARTALRMATLNGAKALGLDTITGSLTISKQADVVAIDLSALETQPLYEPVSQIIYAASRNQITDVWVAGKQLLKNRELLSMDEEQIKQNVSVWQDKLKE
ncbi:MAG: TRZ/ATZ family hydrolase [Gammaproteobacteria bacterium]|nr:TRZ/ATZ family hydrolase [Gammaproteobacteria bacterium]